MMSNLKPSTEASQLQTPQIVEMFLACRLEKFNRLESPMQLLTAHNAKDLEFSEVYIPGANDGVYPFLTDTKIENDENRFDANMQRLQAALRRVHARVRSLDAPIQPFAEPSSEESARLRFRGYLDTVKLTRSRAGQRLRVRGDVWEIEEEKGALSDWIGKGFHPSDT